MTMWATLLRILQATGARARLVMKDGTAGRWSERYISPAASYVEFDGPVHIRDVDAIIVDPIKVQHRGRIVEPKRIDLSESIREQLERERIAFTRTGSGHFRIPTAIFREIVG